MPDLAAEIFHNAKVGEAVTCEACEEKHSTYALHDAIGWTYSIMCLECVDVYIEQGHMTKDNLIEVRGEKNND